MSMGKGLGNALSPMDEAPLSLRILIVDDHVDTGRVIKALLGQLGYVVTTAPDMRSAIDAAIESEFDLLISDIGLPDGSGLELMAELKKRFSIKGIALSGFGEDEDLAKSRAAGFSEHLTKPIEFSELEKVIRRVVGGE